MKSIFEMEYKRIKAFEAAFDNAATDEEKQKAMSALKMLSKAMEAEGYMYCMLYGLYEESRDKGNQYIDISAIHTYKDEAALMEACKEYGITKFTFSSAWSSAIESAMKFVKNGAKLEGLVEINVDRKQKKPAYLFSIGE